MHRGLKYAGMRAASNVLLRDVNIVADHRGDVPRHERHLRGLHRLRRAGPPLRPGAGRVVRGARRRRPRDRHARKAAEDAPRPYKFIVLSDHGQSLGATFKQRYGTEPRRGRPRPDERAGDARPDQDRRPRARPSSTRSCRRSPGARASGRPSPAPPSPSQTTDGVVDLDEEEIPPPADESTIAVVGSGNLGLVWFTGHDHRLTVEELEELHPGLVATLAAHPGVGLLMVRSSERGRGRPRSRTGVRYLDEDRVEGEDPTTLFGQHTIMSLKREDAMVHAPDLLLLSQYDPELGEVAAFEELIGSHGGLGGPQTRAVHPPSRGVGARRGRAARRAGDLPEHPALAEGDRHRARQADPGRTGAGAGHSGGRRSLVTSTDDGRSDDGSADHVLAPSQDLQSRPIHPADDRRTSRRRASEPA